MSKYIVTIEVETDENVHDWDIPAVLDGVLTWSVEEVENHDS